MQVATPVCHAEHGPQDSHAGALWGHHPLGDGSLWVHIKAPVENLCTWAEDPPGNCGEDAEDGIRPDNEDFGSPIERGEAPGQQHPGGIQEAPQGGGLPESRPPDPSNFDAVPRFFRGVSQGFVTAPAIARHRRDVPSSFPESDTEVGEVLGAHHVVWMEVVVIDQNGWMRRLGHAISAQR